jgi:hypothetical protein
VCVPSRGLNRWTPEYKPDALLLEPNFFFNTWGGVRLSPFGTAATNWPIVPAPVDRWWVWSSWWNESWQEKPNYSEKTCHNATLSTTNPTRPGPCSNPGHRSRKPATNRLSCGTAAWANLLEITEFCIFSVLLATSRALEVTLKILDHFTEYNWMVGFCSRRKRRIYFLVEGWVFPRDGLGPVE